MISIPLLKSSRFCSMNISGSTDRGLVSKQDMNISSTFSSTLGTFEKGLFLKLVHNPLSIKISLTFSLLA